jgi:hypothetical protein
MAKDVADVLDGKEPVVRDYDPKDASIEVGSGKKKENKRIKTLIKDFILFMRQEKSYKKQKEEVAEHIREFTGNLRDENALAGDYQKTYRLIESVDGGIETAVNVTQTDKFSKIIDDAVQGIKKVVGDTFFNKFFEKDISISIKPEMLADKTARQELSEALVKALGVDGVKKYFVKEEAWAIKDGLDKGQYELGKDTLPKFREVVKQNADAISESSKKIAVV